MKTAHHCHLTLDRVRATKYRTVRRRGHTGPFAARREAAETRAWSEDVKVEVHVDMEGICKRVGTRAARTMRGAVKLMGGLIAARVVERIERDVDVTVVPLHPDFEEV